MNKAVKATQVGIAINLLIAALIIFRMIGFTNLIGWLYVFFFNIMIGITGLYYSGKYIGKRMDHLIRVNHFNAVVTGIIGVFIILLVGILAGSTLGFLQKCMDKFGQDTVGEIAIDYYIKPIFWIMLFGFLPTLITGSILGIYIKKISDDTN